MLIGLPDLAKERKLSKNVINRRLPNSNIPYLFLLRGDILLFLPTLINSKLIVELVSRD